MSTTRRHPFAWAMWIAAAVVAGAFAYGAWMIVVKGGAAVGLGFGEAPRGNDWVIHTVLPTAAAATVLRPGDRIITVNGVPPQPRTALTLHRRRLLPGDHYTITIDRDGQRQTRDMEVWTGPSDRAIPLVFFFVTLAWCLIGLWIGIARPGDPVARLAATTSLAVGLVFLSVEVLDRGPLWAPLHVVLGYHFFARFPTGAPVTGRWRAALWGLYLTGGLAVAIHLAFGAVWITGGLSAAVAFPHGLLGVRDSFGLVAFSGSIVGMLTVLLRNYRLVTTEDQRRRVRWVFYASLVALAPEAWWATIALLERYVGPTGLPRGTVAANLVPILIPLSVAYAVVKHRVFDISVAIRLGVQYLLARQALQALIVLPIVALLYILAINRNRTLADIVTQSTGYIYWIAVASAGLLFRRRIRLWLDRRFFREEHDREQVLVALVDDVGRVDSISALSRVISDKVEIALHPKSMYLWYLDPTESAIVSKSNPALTPPDFPAGPWLSWLERHDSPIALPLPTAAGISAREADWLASREVSLVVPISDSNDRMIGVLLLGEKRSEEPYTPSDRRLLRAVARQTAAARENLYLRAKVSEEQRIRHDVLERLDGRLSTLLKECPDCGTCFDGNAERCDRDGRALVLSLPVSRIVDGKYRLDRLIGKGGMGAVYEARDLRLDRSVAVKILLGRMFGEQTAARRFQREARAAARLNHPNIVRVYDVGALEGEGAYLVMERIDGVTLRAVLARNSALSPAEAADWFDPILDGIAAAHAMGIVHRDLKPDNVIRETRRPGGPSPGVKILDFGLAKIHAADLLASDTLTVQGILVGTLGYMSPEQLFGGAVDHRTDIFAIGVMLVEALTGRRPFHGETYAALSRAVLDGDFHLSVSTPEATAIDALVQQCLAKEATNRIESAAELRRELVPALRACQALR